MKKVLKYNNKVITILPYSTLQERDLLLYTSGVYEVDSVFDIVKDNFSINKPFSISNLTDIEKKFLLLEIRQISVSEVFSFIKTCNKCNKKSEINVTFDKVLSEGNLKPWKNYQINEAFSHDYNKYVDFDIDELDLNNYDELTKYIDDNKTKFNFNKNVQCIHCENIQEISLTINHIIENLSEDTLTNYYQSIASMVYYGHYSKIDIDSMIPFERSIYLSLLNEELKKYNEEVNANHLIK